MELLSLFKKSTFQHKQIDVLLKKLFFDFFVVVFVFGSLSVLNAFVCLIRQNFHTAHIVQIITYFVFVFIFVFRKKFPIHYLVVVFISAFSCTAIFNFLNFGVLSMSMSMFLFVSAIMATFWEARYSLLYICATTLFLILGATLTCTGLLYPKVDIHLYILSSSSWISKISLYVMLSVLLLIAIKNIKEHLFSLLGDLEDRSAELAISNLQLIEKERKLRGIFDTAPESIVTVSTTGLITTFNKATLGLLECDDANLLASKSIFDFFRSEDHLKILEDIELLKSHQILRNIEYNLLCMNGKIKVISVSSSILTNEKNEIYGQLVISKDITFAKESESRLRQSEKMEAIGQLAGGIAHDFNNQLTGISGYAELLKEVSKDNFKALHYIDNILISAKRSADLTSQLLTFSRKSNSDMMTVNIHQIIVEAAEMLARTIDRRILLKLHLNATYPNVMGDSTQLQNAILNVAINARDAMPNGGQLTFSTCNEQMTEDKCNKSLYELTPGPYIKMSIADTGIGIEPSLLEKIFEPFFTTKEEGKGTGMGLASVYGTIRNHKGAIEVESVLGLGTTMHLYIPQKLHQKEKRSNTTIIDTVAEHASHILIVDDEEFVLDSTSLMLKYYGYSTSTCSESKAAIHFYRENYHKIDLVILDLILPEMNGKEVYAVFKQINPQLKVLFSSGYTLDDESEDTFDGLTDMISKPYHKNELLQKIKNILNQTTT